MCLGRRPPTPQLPPKEPVDSAIEETADSVKVANKRPTKKKKKGTGLTAMGGNQYKGGTKSLQIPLLDPNALGSGNLNYPV